MPSSITQVFSAAGLKPFGVVRWGATPPVPEPGVYVVSLTDSTDAVGQPLDRAPLDRTVFETWLRVRPELTLDGTRPSQEQLTQRVAGFWLPDECIVYIGFATTLSSRVRAYYRTPIGARRPHAGGYFLKLLANLDQLWVHYAPSADPEGAEDAMLGAFCSNVSAETKAVLRDPAHPFPFANLEWPRGVRKAHGLRGAREPRVAARGEVPPSVRPAKSVAHVRTSSTGSDRTQRVTAADLRAGQIRIPAIGSAATKGLLPSDKGTVEMTLRGRTLSASWDPRMGPDRERSGILRVGPILRQLVTEDEVLYLTVEAGVTEIR